MASPASVQEDVHLFHVPGDSDGRAYPDYFVHLTFEFVKEDESWCGLCLELGTAAFSDTREKARDELLQATNLQLTEVEKLGELQVYFGEREVSLYPIPQPWG